MVPRSVDSQTGSGGADRPVASQARSGGAQVSS